MILLSFIYQIWEHTRTNASSIFGRAFVEMLSADRARFFGMRCRADILDGAAYIFAGYGRRCQHDRIFLLFERSFASQRIIEAILCHAVAANSTS